MSEWQPIETAPMDGFFLVHEDGAIRTMLRENGYWLPTAIALDEYGDPSGGPVRETGVHNPTHWMPLPDPPKPDMTAAMSPGEKP